MIIIHNTENIYWQSGQTEHFTLPEKPVSQFGGLVYYISMELV